MGPFRQLLKNTALCPGSFTVWRSGFSTETPTMLTIITLKEEREHEKSLERKP
ncbi:MAG: hypothetical protein NTV32_05410 [Gammaproteobacteria bacterium]|nr:hypothetical protein [Gammaproteobacteria bacterium]